MHFNGQGEKQVETYEKGLLVVQVECHDGNPCGQRQELGNCGANCGAT